MLRYIPAFIKPHSKYFNFVTYRSFSTMTTIATPKDVLDFWFGTDETLPVNKNWFAGGPEYDTEILTKFGPTIDAGLNDTLPEPWKASETDVFARIAHIILLDQFPRNAYRGTAKSFAGDKKSFDLSNSALDAGMFDHKDVKEWHMVFALMPFQHVEDLEAQKKGLKAIEKYCAELWADKSTRLEHFAKSHLVTIERFGRFPHRNTILGRESTPEEVKYLQNSNHEWEKSTSKDYTPAE